MNSRSKIDLLPQWNEPTQDRGWRRVEAILGAAKELMLEAGSAEIKMSHIALRAGIPIGSVYQFFPTRDALIGQLYNSEMARIDRGLEAGLASASSLDELVTGISSTLQSQLDQMRSNPGLAFIWTSISTHPAVVTADAANSDRNAKLLADRLVELSDTADARLFYAAALLICNIWGQVLRLCLQSDNARSELLLSAFARVIESRIKEIAAMPE